MGFGSEMLHMLHFLLMSTLENEMEEFSLYCIVEGETFNVPLTKDHYILDVTTGLHYTFRYRISISKKISSFGIILTSNKYMLYLELQS